MKKKYKCRLSASSLLINIKGKVLRLEFEPDVINAYGLRGCSYSTDKADVQSAIEHNKRFGSVLKDSIWTDDKEEKKPKSKPVKPVEKKPIVPEVPVQEELQLVVPEEQPEAPAEEPTLDMEKEEEVLAPIEQKVRRRGKKAKEE